MKSQPPPLLPLLRSPLRLEAIRQELNPLSEMPQIHQELSRLLVPHHERGLHPEQGPDLGLDIGL